jgi:hypothetical protein
MSKHTNNNLDKEEQISSDHGTNHEFGLEQHFSFRKNKILGKKKRKATCKTNHEFKSV